MERGIQCLSMWGKLVGYRWVYAMKLNLDGSLALFKARLVAKGYPNAGSWLLGDILPRV